MASDHSSAPLALQQLEEWARSHMQRPIIPASTANEQGSVIDLRGAAAPATLKAWVAQALHHPADQLRLRPIAAVAATSHHVPHSADGEEINRSSARIE
jgi:hypothetical protein